MLEGQTTSVEGIFKTIRSLGDIICNHKIEIHEVDQEQAGLLEYILCFNSKTKTRSNEDKNTKIMFLMVKKIFMKVQN